MPSPGAVPCMAVALPEMRDARTREDSLALAARYEREPPGGDERCGALLAGYLIGMTSSPAEDTWRERLRGVALLEVAFRSYDDEPRLYLAMGLLLYHRQARTDALRRLGRALERRDDGEVPLTRAELAIVHYTRGLIHQDEWRDWRSFGQLKSTAQGQWTCGRSENRAGENFTSSAEDHTWLIVVNLLCPDRFAENMATFFDPRASLKTDALATLETEFSQALEYNPAFLPAVEALLGEYLYLADWEKAELVARAVRAHLPEDYRGYLYLAAVLHETGRDSLAEPLVAMSHLYMPDSVSAVFADIGRLLTPDQAAWFAAADSATRLRAVTAYWNSLDPMYLTNVNERKIEHYSRIVSADLMFSSPALRERGWSSPAGEFWIRYGRPQSMWELATPSGRVVFWDYGPGADISFTRGTAYRSYRPTDELFEYAAALRRSSPQAYQAMALIDSVFPLVRQVVRLLDPQRGPEFLIYTEWPDSAGPEASAGLVLFNPSFLPVAQWRGARPDEAGLRVNLRGVPAGSYSLTVEVYDPRTRQLGRVRDTVSTLALGDSLFVVSDVLLAARVSSTSGDGAVSRTEMEIEPLYGGTLAAGGTLGLYWEVYRLRAGDASRARARVTVEIRDASRRPIVARVLRGVGIGGDREPTTRIRYESDRPMVAGRVVEWLELSGALEPGEYSVVVTVEDAQSGRSITRERALTVR